MENWPVVVTAAVVVVVESAEAKAEGRVENRR